MPVLVFGVLEFSNFGRTSLPKPFKYIYFQIDIIWLYQECFKTCLLDIVNKWLKPKEICLHCWFSFDFPSIFDRLIIKIHFIVRH